MYFQHFKFGFRGLKKLIVVSFFKLIKTVFETDHFMDSYIGWIIQSVFIVESCVSCVLYCFKMGFGYQRLAEQ